MVSHLIGRTSGLAVVVLSGGLLLNGGAALWTPIAF